jgi:hypothetical protein
MPRVSPVADGGVNPETAQPLPRSARQPKGLHPEPSTKRNVQRNMLAELRRNKQQMQRDKP